MALGFSLLCVTWLLYYCTTSGLVSSADFICLMICASHDFDCCLLPCMRSAMPPEQAAEQLASCMQLRARLYSICA